MSFWDGTRWVPEETARAGRPSRVRGTATHIVLALAEAGMAAILAVGLVAGTAFAGKGGGTTATPWIALASVDGNTSAALPQPSLGSSVGFAAGYPKNTKNPWVSLSCYQDGTLVYGEGGKVDHTFVLGGGSSLWLSVGGSATCTAEFGDLYWKGGYEYYTYLATTSFSAGG